MNPLQNKSNQMIAVAIVAFAGGSFGGYILGKRRGTVTIVPPKEPEATQLSIFDEVTPLDMRTIQKDTSKQLNDVHPVVVAYDEAAEAPAVQVEIEDDRVVVNVFSTPDGDWDHDIELSQRNGVDPYIIHADEYIEDEMGFTQETVTFYEGDEIMVDSHETPMYGWARIMGELRFGHGSKDPNVVYIRNEGIEMEWEVLRHTGSYSIEVRGLEADEEVEEEIRHSRHAVLKFRGD